MAKKSKKKEKYITLRTSKAGNQSYEICIRAFDQTFRKSVKVSDFETPSQALTFACQLRDETLVKMQTGYTVSNFRTVGELYKKTFEFNTLSLKTKRKYDFVYKASILPYEDTTIDRITSGDIQLSVNSYGKTHTKKETTRCLTIWKRIYEAAALMNINVIDRTVGIKIGKCVQAIPKKKEISADDLEAFCDALRDYNSGSRTGSYRSMAIYYAIRIMQYCGLRPAETFALLKSDIHLSAGYISITKASHSTETSILEISNTKTGKSVRNVPIPAALVPILKDCLAWSHNEILLSDFHGNLMDIDDISNLIRNVAKKTKIEFNLYMLRHQYSTDLMNMGISPNIIRDLMGHTSASMSLDYATSRNEDRIKAVNDRKFS